MRQDTYVFDYTRNITNEKIIIWLVKSPKHDKKINGTETNASLQHHTECIQKSVTENVHTQTDIDC